MPLGSRLKEIEVFASGSGSLNAIAYRNSLIGTNITSLNTVVAVPGGGSGIITLDQLVDGNNVFMFELMGSSSNLRYQSARVGFIPPYRRVVTVSPQVRAYNTRDASLARFANNEERVVDLSSVVPAGATAAIVTLTTTQQDAAGYLGMFPDGTAWPNTSNINYSVGQDIANSSIVASARGAPSRSAAAAVPRMSSSMSPAT